MLCRSPLAQPDVGRRREREDGAEACAARAREIVDGSPSLPLPGGGATLDRWAALAAVAVEDLSVARLVEGHHDAAAILAELGHAAVEPGLLGVWAARPEELTARRAAGRWTLHGTKPFCSGANLLDAALVTATTDDGPALFLVEAGELPTVPGSWAPLGMAATRSETVVFDGLEVAAGAQVGSTGSYVSRPGFGHGGSGVAACWWGGARAVVDDLATVLRVKGDDAAMAAFAHAVTALDHGRSTLRDAAREIDATPADVEVALRTASSTRYVCAESARVVLDVAARHLGTSSLGVQPAVAARLADLTTYLTQYRDAGAADLGRRLLGRSVDGLSGGMP